MRTELIQARYRVMTPMFCGGAFPKETAELRLSSYKGVLRWFWRAVSWVRFDGDLREIQSEEDQLFGSSRTGQGRVTMRLVPLATQPLVWPAEALLRQSSASNSRMVGDGVRYLGYGVVDAFGPKAGQLTRACIPGPLDFTIELRCRDVDSQSRTNLMDAIRAVGLLGGLGGKSRKGFGSLVLRELLAGGTAEWEAPKTTDELKQEIQNLYRRHDAASPGLAQLPLYTALSARARHVLIADGQSEPFILLDRIGRELMRYRSWGNRGRVLNEPREGNFKDDHDLMKAYVPERKTHPRRAVFGLPHNYSNRDSSSKVRRDQQVLPDEFPLDRRASPLLIHIHECGNRPVAVLSFLPAQFLPTKGGSSKMNVGGAHVELVRDPDLWNPIEQFLARLLDPSLRKEPFTDGLEIVPS